MKSVTVPFFISHQGCPHTCVFCNQRTISGSGGDIPDNRQIAAKIREWQRFNVTHRPLEVAFFGGTFTALSHQVQQQLLSGVRPFLVSGDVRSVRISTRPDSIDTETVRWLVEWGVQTIEVGVQSMDDDVLMASGRGHDATASLKAIQCIKSCGLSAGAQLMPGLPSDTAATALYSLNRVISAGADFVRLYPAVVLQDTMLAQLYRAGEYRPLTVDEGVAICKALVQTALKSGIPVIRIGLQASEGLDPGAILAGCWHPAFGELVYGELFYDLLAQLTGSASLGASTVEISCHPARISSVIGHKRKNISRLHKQGITVNRVIPNCNLSIFECEISLAEKQERGSILDHS